MTRELDGQLMQPVTIVVMLWHTLVMGDRRLKVAEIASEVGITCGSAIDILRQHLDLRKVCKMGSMIVDAHSEIFSWGNKFRTAGSQ